MDKLSNTIWIIIESGVSTVVISWRSLSVHADGPLGSQGPPTGPALVVLPVPELPCHIGTTSGKATHHQPVMRIGLGVNDDDDDDDG